MATPGSCGGVEHIKFDDLIPGTYLAVMDTGREGWEA